MSVLCRWNMMSCCSDASSRQMDSTIKPSRQPIVPLRASGRTAACPARLHGPIWQWSWKTASSLSTRLSSRRSSPASKRPKRTSAKTDVQTGRVNPRAQPNSSVTNSSLCNTGLALIFLCESFLTKWETLRLLCNKNIQRAANAISALSLCASKTCCNPLISCHVDAPRLLQPALLHLLCPHQKSSVINL